MENANYVNILSKYKDKIIISTRNDIKGILKDFEKNKVFLMKNLYKKADKYILISKEMQEDAINLLKIPEYKTKIIYNYINIKEIQELSREDLMEYKSIFKHPVLINVGRLAKQKGQWYLIRILKNLQDFIKDLKLVILGFGDGELKEYLINLSRDIGLKTYVAWESLELSENYDIYFLGFQKNPYKFIANSKLFLLSSLSEGLGNVLIEALACGIPVISSDCRVGPRDILAPDTDYKFQTKEPFFAKYGILMPVFDGNLKKHNDPLSKEELMWCNTTKNLLMNESITRNLVNNSKERADDFNTEKIINEWINLLENE